MTNKYFIAGSDLAPLPYESSRSVLARLGWRTGRTMAPILAAYRSSLNSGIETDEQIGSPLYVLTRNWLRSMSDELRFYENGRIVPEGEYKFFERRFRFCPLCLEECYHSYFFQWKALHICPRHCCQLVVHCQRCGKDVDQSIPDFPQGQSRIGRTEYDCQSCGQPICGARPDLQLHLQLRADPLNLSEILGKVASQFAGEFERMSFLYSALYRWTWHHHDDFAGSLQVLDGLQRLVAQCPLPVGLSQSLGLTFVRWQSRQLEEISEGRVANKVGSSRSVISARAVYLVTRRRIARWIFRRASVEEEDRRLWQRFSDIKPQLLVDDWPRLELAYLFLCSYMESFVALPLDRRHLIVFAPQPEPFWHTERLREFTRSAYSAWFLCSFSMIYHGLSKHRDLPVLNAIQVMKRHPVWLTTISIVQSVGVNSGMCYFPTVEGMPLAPFKTGNVR